MKKIQLNGLTVESKRILLAHFDGEDVRTECSGDLPGDIVQVRKYREGGDLGVYMAYVPNTSHVGPFVTIIQLHKQDDGSVVPVIKSLERIGISDDSDETATRFWGRLASFPLKITMSMVHDTIDVVLGDGDGGTIFTAHAE